MRINCGCGEYRLEGYCNIDADPSMPADLFATVPPLPFADGSLEEVWACHFLEHLYPQEATEFLTECYRCLVPGGKLGVMVPDTREILGNYLIGQNAAFEYPGGVVHMIRDLDEVCRCFLYGSVQESQHRWSFDLVTLRRALTTAGFQTMRQINRYDDPRLGSPGWFQAGWDAIKPREEVTA